MKKVKAVFNGGLWKANCPKHKELGAVLAEPSELSMAWTEDNEYICPVCHPGYFKTANMLVGGKLVKRFDRSTRKTAKALATEKGQVYQVVFPVEKAEIEQILSARKEIDPITKQIIGKNWKPGETLAFLHAENKQLGLE